MLNLIKNGEVIRQVAEGSAVHVDNVYVSPAEAGWSYGDYRLEEAPEPEPEPPTKQELAEYAAAKRYEKEVGGTIWNGWPVHTDRESQPKIIAERLAIAEGRRQDPDGWKFADGVFRMVSNDDFVTLSDAVREHVRQCYAIEAQALAGIENGDITSKEEVDAAFA